jgi:Mg/Co/Ni transporter MgtE
MHHLKEEEEELSLASPASIDIDAQHQQQSPSLFKDIWQQTKSRAPRRFSVLVTLLLFQSLSSFVLERYEGLLEKHVEVMLFLTMLVGAGGNAGNQAAVRVIRDLAVQRRSITSNATIMLKLMLEETMCGVILALALGIAAFARVGAYFYLTGGIKDNSWTISLAISLSLLLIVFISIVVGAGLPLFLNWAGMDPAHAGPAIQVIMDITGVLITCIVCSTMLA